MKTRNDARRLGGIAIAIASLLLAGGCGGTKGTDTPEHAVAQHFERLAAGDIDGAWELFTEGMKREVDAVKKGVQTWPPNNVQKELGLDKASVAEMSPLEFYKANGMITLGDEYDVPLVGPHYLMWRRI